MPDSITTLFRCIKCQESLEEALFFKSSIKGKSKVCKKCKSMYGITRAVIRNREKPNSRLAQSIRSRERRHGLPAKLSAEDVDKICASYEHKCALTGNGCSTNGKMPLVRFDLTVAISRTNAVLVEASGHKVASLSARGRKPFSWSDESLQRINTAMAK